MVEGNSFAIIISGTVTQYPIPSITVPGRMRYSCHKRSGISYSCHNESPRTTFSCHKRSCFAIGYPLSRIYCRCSMYRRLGVGVSADNSSLRLLPYHLPMDRLWQCKLMLVHTLTIYGNKVFPHPPPQTFYMLMKSFHIHSMAMKYFHISPPPPHAHTLPGPDILSVLPTSILVLQIACFTIYNNNNIPFHMVLYFHP